MSVSSSRHRRSYGTFIPAKRLIQQGHKADNPTVPSATVPDILRWALF
jgi:hypothetical protein